MFRSRTEAAVDAWESLFRSQVTLMRRFTAEDIWKPIGVREYDVLYTLSRCPGHTIRLRDLNAEILLSQPSLSRMCERLETSGYVLRRNDPGDGRGTLVSLTDAGAALQRSIGRKHSAQIARLVGGALEPSELAELDRLCTKLRNTQAGIE